MTLLPIVGRELRVATRRRVTYWSRVGAAGVAVVLVLWMVTTASRLVTPEQIGLQLFRTLARLAFFLCLWPGVLLTADCLSEEKREGTLGLLFLTDLRGYDVVLGKLMGTSLGAFYALLAIFPALALPLVLGGVTGGEFWRVALALANTMLFSLAVGLVVSAISRRAQRAMAATAGTVALVTFGVPGLGGLSAVWSPLTLFRQSFETVSGGAWLFYLLCLVCQHSLVWALLAVASFLAPHTWQTKSLSARIRSRWTAWFRPSDRRRPGDGDPVEWLALLGSRSSWVWVTLALAVVAWVAWIPGSRLLLLPAVVLGAVLWQGILQFWLAWEACRRFQEARRSRTLEALLSVPLTVEEIVRGQLRSLHAQFLAPVMAVLVLEMGSILLAPAITGGGMVSAFMPIMVSVMGTLVTSVYGLRWLGLWMGLKHTRAVHGLAATLGWIVLVPLAVFLGSVTCLIISGIGVPEFPTALAALWLMISGIAAHLSVEYARHQLRVSFRRVAAGDPPERASFWGTQPNVEATTTTELAPSR